ncbi:MAG: hypothetical protein HXS50_01620, partial [Theionarchaea archaeon]|nr:hypothetical protein [Theionarchaea archaeon]
TKPAGYEFDNFERNFSGVDFTLVEIDGKADAVLQALPAVFNFTIDEFKKWAEEIGDHNKLRRQMLKACD